MSSLCGELVGIERNGTVRKLCLVHSIIASGHGGRENKEGLPGLGFSCYLQTFYLGRDLCESKREREPGFSFHVYNYPYNPPFTFSCF